MEFNYKYTAPSNCSTSDQALSLNLSYDINRPEKVSFLGKLKRPLVFRDALLMLREIVTLDTSVKKIPRPEFFKWLADEIERRTLLREANADLVRQDLLKEMQPFYDKLTEIDNKLAQLNATNKNIVSQINETDAWKDYYALERQFWSFIKSRDYNLWFVLDPVITVHKDIVSFEAFSIDESVYGNLSIPMDEFELLQPPKLGTTNIDFSDKLATEISRFRTYNDVMLSINPEGLEVVSDVYDSYTEKKIDLPDSWIHGFNQVSSASMLSGICIDLSPMDVYDLCNFIKRYKAHQSPRFMKWILIPNKPVQIIFELSKAALTLQAIYHGKKVREEKIWGRNRWLVLEKLIPLATSFTIKLHGFGMPQFVIAHIGQISMTVGFSSWSRNDWVKGTAFNIMAGFIGNECYEPVYKALLCKNFISHTPTR